MEEVDTIMSQIYKEQPKWFPYGLSRHMLDKLWLVRDPTTKAAAGFTGWQFRPNDKGGTTAWYAVGLLPAFRGKGLAKRALEEMFDKHKPATVSDVKAFIVNGNEPSIGLARRLGVAYQHKAASAGLHGTGRAGNLMTMNKAARHPSVVNLQQYMPITGRRSRFTPAEESAMDEGRSQWFPALFTSAADSPAVDMPSPGKAALLAGLLGGGAGLLGADQFNLAPKTKVVIGGGAGLLSSMLAYFKTRANNEGIEEMMRRIPAGGTRRDIEADPVYQANMDRAAQSGASSEALRTAQMLAALNAVKQANVLKSVAGALKSPAAKYVAYPAIGAAGWDAALYHDSYDQNVPVRALMGLINTAMLGLGAKSDNKLKGLGLAITQMPAKDVMVQAGLQMPSVVDSFKRMADNKVDATAPQPPAENWLQTAGRWTKDNPVTSIAAALGLGGIGAAGLSALRSSRGAGQGKVDNGGRIKVTLPTKKPGDVETSLDLPVDQMQLSDSLMRKLRRDASRRLIDESKERTRHIVLSPEERARRAARLALVRP